MQEINNVIKAPFNTLNSGLFSTNEAIATQTIQGITKADAPPNLLQNTSNPGLINARYRVNTRQGAIGTIDVGRNMQNPRSHWNVLLTNEWYTNSYIKWNSTEFNSEDPDNILESGLIPVGLGSKQSNHQSVSKNIPYLSCLQYFLGKLTNKDKKHIGYKQYQPLYIISDYKNTNKYAYVDFMNSYYDIEYHWSKCGIEMSKINETKSKQLLLSGPIWSSSQFFNKSFTTNINKKKNSITFFTSGFLGFFATNSLEAHEEFLFLVLEIIKNYPNINIIFKPKHNASLYKNYKSTKDLIKNLSSYERFKIISGDTFSSKLSQQSDVVISMPFASSGFEAMCLGVKSFYVDSMNAYKNSYYDNFENLISHSNKQALDNLEHWMKIDQKNVISKYKDIFKDSGIDNNTNKASEVIRNRVINLYNDLDPERLEVFDALPLEEYGKFYSLFDISYAYIEMHNSFNSCFFSLIMVFINLFKLVSDNCILFAIVLFLLYYKYHRQKKTPHCCEVSGELW